MTEGIFDGILVLIDEADKPGPQGNLGSLLKGFTERLTRQSCTHVSVGIAGVSSLIDDLRKRHKFSLRVFNTFNLRPLLENERNDVIMRRLLVAARENGFETQITDDALALIAMFSEGYPHFIQQFAYCAFEADEDNTIDRRDVLSGAWSEYGAFEQLGTKYFEGLYFDQIGSDDYRQVLRAMAEHFDGWVSKDQIRKPVSLKASILNNALTALKKRRIIISQPGHQGVFRLPMKSFAAWIRAYYSALPASDASSAGRDGHEE
jgi:hypothetical protein